MGDIPHLRRSAADYFLIRRTNLDVPELFRKDGKYAFQKGWNWRAMVALVVGVAPNVPGFYAAATRNPEAVAPIFNEIYVYAWFVGFFVSGGLLWLLSAGQPRERPSAAG